MFQNLGQRVFTGGNEVPEAAHTGEISNKFKPVPIPRKQHGTT
jgi:hypothetical protein